LYRVEFTRNANKSLDALPKPAGDRIALAVAALREEPRHRGEKIEKAEALYRIRVGQYRVIYEVRDQELIVLVVRVAKRDERTYRRL
jgi:mRNA interferase RelE/StbE